MRLDYSKKFIKQFRLDNHCLKGKFSGCRSINITGDWREIFREHDSGELIRFDLIGTHSQLYG